MLSLGSLASYWSVWRDAIGQGMLGNSYVIGQVKEQTSKSGKRE